MAAAGATNQLVHIDIKAGGYAVLTMQKEPVNSLDFAAWSALEEALVSLEADPKVNGVIITSGLQRDVFSAGNDLGELYAPKTSFERYERFWITQNRFLVRLLKSRLVTVAAIRGACPAGGCIISLCCDHRLMTQNGHIGLNEVLLGIPVPKYWGLLMAKLTGAQVAEGLLLNGKMVNPGEAKALGLVDEVIADKAQLLPAAEQLIQKLVKLPSSARAATKLSLRDEFCDAWSVYYVTEPIGAWKFLNQPDTLRNLAATLQRLSGGAAKQKSKL